MLMLVSLKFYCVSLQVFEYILDLVVLPDQFRLPISSWQSVLYFDLDCIYISMSYNCSKYELMNRDDVRVSTFSGRKILCRLNVFAYNYGLN